MKRDVANIDYSPAIRAIRVHAADTASASRLLAALRRAPEVETAERDDCSAHLQRP
jgi:hypothetical protein